MTNQIGCIVINFLRPEATIKCIRTLLQQCPDIQIYLGDQDQDSYLKKQYNQDNIHYFSLPMDCGISYARNKLITHALEDGCQYFMWIDNDFVFDHELNITHPLTILQKDATIGAVGGAMKKNKVLMHYERFMYYDRDRGLLIYVPIDLVHPVAKKIDDISYYDCDITFNFVLARKEVWEDTRVRWNENIKVKYEHSTWFLNFQQFSKYKVAYCPTFLAHHEHVGTAEYNKFRFRTSDEDEFVNYFNLKVMFTLGEMGYDFQLKAPTAIMPKKLTPTPVNPILTVNLNKYPDLRKLNEQQVIPILLTQTCLEAIKHHELTSPYSLGFNSDYDLQKAQNLLDPSCQLEIYKRPIKSFQIEGIHVAIPCPVVPYLTTLFGNKWKE